MRFFPALTIVELLVVIAIISIIGVPSILGISGMRSNQSLTASAEKLQHVLTQAHIYARESKDERGWGVAWQDNSTYRFRSRLSATDPSPANEAEYALEQPTVFGGNFDIWFERGTGNANATTIILTNSAGRTARVSVNANGVVEVGQ